MGNIYADSAGEAYLSLWEFGMGINKGGGEVEEWYALREIPPLHPGMWRR